MPTESNSELRSASAVPGFAIVGCLVTGVAGLVFAFVHNDALGIVAAAVAFGAVLFVSFKK